VNRVAGTASRCGVACLLMWKVMNGLGRSIAGAGVGTRAEAQSAAAAGWGMAYLLEP
jgi:hypothetical protein